MTNWEILQELANRMKELEEAKIPKQKIVPLFGSVEATQKMFDMNRTPTGTSKKQKQKARERQRKRDEIMKAMQKSLKETKR